MRIVGVITKLIGSLLIGLALALYVLQHDDRFKASIKKAFVAYFQAADSDLVCKMSDVNLISPTIVLEDVLVRSNDGSSKWEWRASKAIFTFSWIRCLLSRSVQFHLTLTDYRATSSMKEGHIFLASHLKKLFQTPPIVGSFPLVLREVHVRDGRIEVQDSQRPLSLTVDFHGDIRRVKTTTAITLYVRDGTVVVDGCPYAKSWSGSCQVQIKGSAQGSLVQATNSLSFSIPHHDPLTARCFLTGTWAQGIGRFTLCNMRHTLMIDPLTIEKGRLYCTVRTPLSLLSEVVPSLKQLQMDGACTAHFDVDIVRGSGRGDIVIHQGACCGISFYSLYAQYVRNEQQMQGTVALDAGYDQHVTGLFRMHDGGGTLSFANTTPLSVPGTSSWYIPRNDFSCSMTFGDGKPLKILYEASCAHRLTPRIVKTKGSLVQKGTSFLATAAVGDRTRCEALVAQREGIELDHVTVYEDTKEVCSIMSTGTSAYKGFVDYAWLCSLAPESWRDELMGEGILRFDGAFGDGVVRGAMSLEKGFIKIPRMYNVMTSLHGSFVYDRAQRQLQIQDIRGMLHRGTITSPCATCTFDDRLRPSSVHLPLIIDSCFVGWRRDLFALLSGSLVIKRSAGSPYHISGTVMADKARLRANPFSSDAQRSFVAHDPTSAWGDVGVDLVCMTRSPLLVSTAFFDATARAHIRAMKHGSHTTVSGAIELLSGNFKFPYTSLPLVRGSLYFVPEQPYDPLIDVYAKRRIKKYDVGLQLSGSLSSPHIDLESSPTLSDEQIVALLLVGSPEQSLTLVMPSLVAQNLQQIIFGPAQSPGSLHHYFSTLLGPLARVKFIPLLAGETGRGGLRGAMRIEVNDKLSARIEKNLSLSEDTIFEVDYAVSDEINLRGIKDERGDLGGEVEMRFSF